MDEIFRNILFYGIILGSFVVAWIFSGKVRAKKGIWLGFLVSIGISAVILGPGGYYWFLTEPDFIGKGIVVIIYEVAFLLINAVILIRFFIVNSGK